MRQKGAILNQFVEGLEIPIKFHTQRATKHRNSVSKRSSCKEKKKKRSLPFFNGPPQILTYLRKSLRRCAMMAHSMVEKFPLSELQNLRSELLKSGLDSWQAAQVVASFLSGRGYGVNSERVPEAIIRLEGGSCRVDCMQEVLEKVALVM
jgi:hypothetical protein